MAGGVDFFLALFSNAPDRRDAIALHADIRAIFRQTRAIDDGAVTNHEIEHGVSPELSYRGCCDRRDFTTHTLQGTV